jgi:5'-nucleotidase
MQHFADICKMKARKRIAIDMDDVMADVTSHFLNWYEERTGLRLPEEKLVGVPVSQAFPDPGMAWEFLFTPGFFRTIPVMKDSQEVIARLNEEYEVFIVSAAMEFPQSLTEKHDWLQEHFPFISWKQMVLCGSKAVIKADYMIDDHLKNLDYFDGEKLLFTAPHNQLITGYRRVNNWQEVGEFFQSQPALVTA